MRVIYRICAVIFMSLLIAGCIGDEKITAEKVTAEEFQAMLARDLETMKYSEFIGVNDGKAYMKVLSMSTMEQKDWKEKYYYTDAQDLPEEWLRQQQENIKK